MNKEHQNIVRPPPTIPDKWSYFLGLYNLISVSTTDLPINAIDHMTRMGKKEHDFQKISNKKTVKCNEKRNDCWNQCISKNERWSKMRNSCNNGCNEKRNSDRRKSKQQWAMSNEQCCRNLKKKKKKNEVREMGESNDWSNNVIEKYFKITAPIILYRPKKF